MALPRLRDRLKRYTSLPAAIDVLSNKRLALLSPRKWDDTNDVAFIDAYRAHRELGTVLAACFTRAAERYHHWRVFSGGTEGICIEFDRKELLQSLPNPGPYLWGNVEYLTLTTLRKKRAIDLWELPFFKRNGFRDEKEFRLLFEGKEELTGPHHITIQPSWVLRVIVNPWLSDDLVPGITKLLKSFPGFSRLRVDKSSLINSSQWKEACERVDEFAQVLGPPPLKI